MQIRTVTMPGDRAVVAELLSRAAIRDGYVALSEESMVSLEAAVGPAGWLIESEVAVHALAHHRIHRDLRGLCNP